MGWSRGRCSVRPAIRSGRWRRSLRTCRRWTGLRRRCGPTRRAWLWLQFLDRLGVAANEATVDHVSRFVAWLRSPADNVAVLEGGSGRCGPATLNRHLAALFTFYDYRARNGVVLAQSLVAWRRVNRGLS